MESMTTTWLEYIEQLRRACRRRDASEVKFILTGNPHVLAYAQERAMQGMLAQGSPFILCCLLGYDELLPLLFPHLRTLDEAYGGETALHYAVSLGHERVVRFLLAYGARVDIENDETLTAFETAVLHGHEAIVSLFLEYGYGEDVSTAASLKRPLLHLLLSDYNDLFHGQSSSVAQRHLEAAAYRPRVLRLLLAHGHLVDRSHLTQRQTRRLAEQLDDHQLSLSPVQLACSYGDYAALLALLDAGLYDGSDDLSAALRAICRVSYLPHSYAIAQALVERGADVDSAAIAVDQGAASDTAMFTCLSRVAYRCGLYRSSLPFIKLLLRRGVDIRRQHHSIAASDTSRAVSALDFAVQRGLVPVVALFLRHLATSTAASIDGDAVSPSQQNQQQLQGQQLVVSQAHASSSPSAALWHSDEWRFWLRCFDGDVADVVATFARCHPPPPSSSAAAADDDATAGALVPFDPAAAAAAATAAASAAIGGGCPTVAPPLRCLVDGDATSTATCHEVSTAPPQWLPHSPLCVAFFHPPQPPPSTSTATATEAATAPPPPRLFTWILRGLTWLCDQNRVAAFDALVAYDASLVAHYLVDAVAALGHATGGNVGGGSGGGIGVRSHVQRLHDGTFSHPLLLAVNAGHAAMVRRCLRLLLPAATAATATAATTAATATDAPAAVKATRRRKRSVGDETALTMWRPSGAAIGNGDGDGDSDGDSDAAAETAAALGRRRRRRFSGGQRWPPLALPDAAHDADGDADGDAAAALGALVLAPPRDAAAAGGRRSVGYRERKADDSDAADSDADGEFDGDGRVSCVTDGEAMDIDGDGDSDGDSDATGSGVGLSRRAVAIVTEYRGFCLTLLQTAALNGHVAVLETLLAHPHRPQHPSVLPRRGSLGELLFPAHDASALTDLLALLCRLPSAYARPEDVDADGDSSGDSGSGSGGRWAAGVVACVESLLRFGYHRYDAAAVSSDADGGALSSSSSYLAALWHDDAALLACRVPAVPAALLERLLRFGLPLWPPGRLPPPPLSPLSPSPSAAPTSAAHDASPSPSSWWPSILGTAAAAAAAAAPTTPPLTPPAASERALFSRWSLLHEAIVYEHATAVRALCRVAQRRDQLAALLAPAAGDALDVVAWAQARASRSVAATAIAAELTAARASLGVACGTVAALPPPPPPPPPPRDCT